MVFPMINVDEFEPQKSSATPKDLQGMSVNELKDYIAALNVEIVRAEDTIRKKEEHKSGVDALFGKKN